MRLDTKNKRGLKALSYFLPRKGLEEGGTAAGGAKNMPVTYFLARGRVLHIPDASDTDVDGI